MAIITLATFNVSLNSQNKNLFALSFLTDPEAMASEADSNNESCQKRSTTDSYVSCGGRKVLASKKTTWSCNRKAKSGVCFSSSTTTSYTNPCSGGGISSQNTLAVTGTCR